MLGDCNPLKLEEYLSRKHDKNIRNNTDLIKEEIWEIIEKEMPKANRKMFFIKTSKIPNHKLLEFKKTAEKAENFCQCFYGLVKWQNKKIDGVDNYTPIP